MVTDIKYHSGTGTLRDWLYPKGVPVPANKTTAISFNHLRRYKYATIAPEKLCHTLNKAPGMVASGYAAKCMVARLLASPEFCMPTSMDIALFFGSGKPSKRPIRKPKLKPHTL